MKTLILMYHRIVDVQENVDPWNLCVSPQNFNEHMLVLKKIGNIISLSEIKEECQHLNSRINIIITFDDGYSDNYYFALPILEKLGIPATLFIVSGSVNSPFLFYWDEIANIFLKPNILPDAFDYSSKEENFTIFLKKNANYTITTFEKHKKWKVGECAPSTERQKAYIKVWQYARKLNPNDRDTFMKSIREWSSNSLSVAFDYPLSDSNLRSLSDNPLIEIGAHTINHIALTKCTHDVQHEEINKSKIQIEMIIQKPVTSFSYPHGEYDQNIVQLAKKAGYEFCCTTESALVKTGDSPYTLPRLHVKDWNGADFEHILLKLINA